MRSPSFSGLFWAFLFPLTVPVAAAGQGTMTDYVRAFELRDRFSGLLVDAPEGPSWITETSRFWYRKSMLGGNTFVLVDANTLEKRPAFDHARVADALSIGRDTAYTAITLPFDELEFVDDEGVIEFTFADSIWHCDLDSYACGNVRPAPPRRRGSFGQQDEESDEPVVSPNGKSEAFIQNYNVAVRPVGSDTAIMLSMDGSEGNYYSIESIAWSPDSKHLAAYRVRPGYRRIVRYIESSPDDQLQPKYMERVYTKPGDDLDLQQPVLFDVDS